MLPRLGGSLLLAGFAVADFAAIQDVLDSINAGLLNLDKAVTGLPATADILQSLGAAVVPALENATQIVQQSAPLTPEEAMGLGTSTAALRQNSNLTVNDFVAQRAFFDSTNSSGLVLQALAADKAASIALGAALISKLPDLSQIPGGQEMVSASSMDLISIYDRGIALFSSPAQATGVTSAPNVESNTGTLNEDGSCNCAVQCPAGSLGLGAVMQMMGVMGTTGTPKAPALQMLPGASNTGSGMSGLKPLGG